MNNLRSRLACIVIAIFFTSCGDKAGRNSSNFQGTLTYTQDLSVGGTFLAMGATKELLLEKMRSEGDWADTIRITYNSRGDYRVSAQNAKHSYKIYRADSNKIYTFIDGENSTACTVQVAVDLDFVGDADLPTKVHFDTTVVIAGVKCKAKRFAWKRARLDYFYDSTKLNVDPAPYARHTTEAFADFLASTQSLPFGITRNIGGLLIEQRLINSKDEEVSADQFKLPTLVKDDALNPMKLPGIEVMRVARSK